MRAKPDRLQGPTPLARKAAEAAAAVIDRSLLVTHGRWRDYVRKDLTGHRSGRLKVLGPVGVSGLQLIWLCQCDCGARTTGTSTALTTKTGKCKKRSCGCLQTDVQHQRSLRHGHSLEGEHSTVYRAWIGAKVACYDAHHQSFPNTGGRGIVVCKQWVDDFPAFLRDMGPCPEGWALSRLNIDRDYEPMNCEWAPLSVVRSRAGRSMFRRDFADECDTRQLARKRELLAAERVA